MSRLRILVLLLSALPLIAQESALFPRFSLTGASNRARFDSTVRLDPENIANAFGSQVGFESDLGMPRSKTLTRFGLEWQLASRHELAATYFTAPRSGFAAIQREIVFRDQTYPVQALVTSQFDLKYASATYTYWARRTARDGLGITLGAATLSVDASVLAQRPDLTLLATERANTDVPVALAGLQGRIAFTPRLLGAASFSALPRITVSGYRGRARTANASLEYRASPWLGIGAAYDDFHLDVDSTRADLRGALSMSIRGPEVFVRLAF